MKLEILQENLNHALNLAVRLISSKPTTPILSHLLLVAKNNQFTITASNLETTLILPVGAKIIKEGEFTIPARQFQEIIASLSAEKIELEVKEGVLAISSGSFLGTLNGTPASEYPQLDVSSSREKEIALSPDKLISAISKTAYCAATDEGRAVLTGILFKALEKHLQFVATDGFRLSVVSLPKDKEDNLEDLSVVLPARTLAEVAKILIEKDRSNKDGQSITLAFLPNNQFLFVIDDIKIYSRLISGNFPDFEKIIPSQSGLKVLAETQELIKAIRLAAIFARDSANIVKLKITGKKLKISANAAQVGGNESNLEIEVEKGSDEEFQIAFNYRYLLDFLSNLGDSKEISLEFTTPLAPGVLKSPSDSHFLHLIMPVRVQS